MIIVMHKTGPKKYCETYETLKNTTFIQQPKNTAAATSTPKNTDFRNSKPLKKL